MKIFNQLFWGFLKMLFIPGRIFNGRYLRSKITFGSLIDDIDSAKSEKEKTERNILGIRIINFVVYLVVSVILFHVVNQSIGWSILIVYIMLMIESNLTDYYVWKKYCYSIGKVLMLHETRDRGPEYILRSLSILDPSSLNIINKETNRT